MGKKRTATVNSPTDRPQEIAERTLRQLRQATAEAKTTIREAHEARQDLLERQKAIDALLATQIHQLVDQAVANILEARTGDLSREFGQFARELYDKVQGEADRLVGEFIKLDRGSRRLTAADVMAAKLTMNRWMKDNNGGPLELVATFGDNIPRANLVKDD